MPKKKQQPVESNNLYDAELEQHVDEMLAPETDTQAVSPKKIAIKEHVEDTVEPAASEAASAPVLPDVPVPKEPLKISVFHDQAEEPKKEEPIANEAADDESAPLEVPGLPVVLDEPKGQEAVPIEEPVAAQPIVPIDFGTTDDIPLESPLDAVLADEKVEGLVDDIVAKESDELLAAEDARTPIITTPAGPTFGERIRGFFKGWFKNPVARWLTILFVVGVLGAGVGIPASRYYVLNGVGVRSQASVTVIDQSTQQPLKNAVVKVADQSAQTDENGVVKLSNLRLGPTQLAIEKRAFAPINQLITIGWGSNPLPEYALEPTGSQYAFKIVDYLSDKPIGTASATSEYADANADEKGVIKLTLDEDAKETVEVTITSPGYREEKVIIDAKTKLETTIKLASNRKHAFVSNRDGNYDVYRVDIDGKNEKVILPGTGTEREDMILAPSPNQNVVAVVSTRDNARNKDGYLLSTLTIVDLETAQTVKVSQSEQIHVIGWSNGRLAYVQIAAGASAANPDRERLMSYDYAKRDNKQLTSANYFNDIMSVGEFIYYAPTGGNSDPNGNFTRIKFDGSNKKVLLVAEAWNAFRVDYEHIVISVPGGWYEHTIGSATAKKLEGQPANTTHRTYIDSPDSKVGLRVGERDGKGALLRYSLSDKKETVLTSASGLKYPLKWLDNKTIVYRVNTDEENADYVVNVDGGKPKKITDVTTVGSNDRWYYY